MSIHGILGTTTLNDQVQDVQLEITGNIPDWIHGTLLRTGPAKFEIGKQKYNHWFDGLAMIHKYDISKGAVKYSNKFLESDAYKGADKDKEISLREFATDPCKSIFKQFTSVFLRSRFTDNPNVNTAMIDGKYVSLTETTMPIVFDKDTLKTIGHIKYSDSQKDLQEAQIGSAHPHDDDSSQISYMAKMGRVSSYMAYQTQAGAAERQIIAKIDGIKEPAYMHSFALSKNYIIFTEFPFVVSPMNLLLGSKPFIENFVWKPERGTRFIIISRKDGSIRYAKSDAFFAFHHVNAFETDDSIVVDIIAYENPDIISNLYLDVIRGSTTPKKMTPSELRRYIIKPDGSTTWSKLSEQPVELPRINYESKNTKVYKFVYGIADTKGYGIADGIVKIDITDDSTKGWSEKDCYPGEPVFVPKPGSEKEDEGAILSIVLDTSSKKSFLLVLDSATFEEQARAQIMHHVPFSFHGNFFSAQDL